MEHKNLLKFEFKVFKFTRNSNIIKPKINMVKMKFHLKRKSIVFSKHEIEM